MEIVKNFVDVLEEYNCTGLFRGNEPTAVDQITTAWLNEDVGERSTRLEIHSGVLPSIKNLKIGYTALLKKHPNTPFINVLRVFGCTGVLHGDEPTSIDQITESWLKEKIGEQRLRLEIHSGTLPSITKLKASYTTLLQANIDTEYMRLRAAAYPPLQDQLDMIYNKGIDGWKAEIKKIKLKYPKPKA